MIQAILGGVALVGVVGLAVVALVIYLLIRYFGAKNGTPVPPVSTLLPAGIVTQLIEGAKTGNAAMIEDALLQEIKIEMANGGTQVILGTLIAAARRRLADPNAQTPLIKAVAWFTGRTEQQVLDAVQAEYLTPVSVVPSQPAVVKPVSAAAAVATALVLLFVSSAAGASPTWGMPVKGPQRFYSRDTSLIVDPPLMRDAHGQLVAYQSDVGYRVGAHVAESPTQWAEPVYSNWQPKQQVGWWDRGPVRRFFARRGRLFGRVFGRRC